MQRNILAASFALALAGTGIVPANSLAQSKQGDAATIRIDLSATDGPVQRSAAGFLHGVSKNKPPLDQKAELYDPIKVRFLREKTGMLAEVHDYDPHAVLVGTLSGSWGYAMNKNAQPPWKDWKKWDQFVTDQVTALRDKGIHPIYDLWNEPNQPQWFGPWSEGKAEPGWEGATFEKFCELWQRTYKLVRKLDPKAKLTAPGITYPDRDGMDWLRKFKDFCAKNDCVPDYWNWHFGGDLIPKHAAEAVGWKLNDGAFITEYLGPDASMRPGRTAYEIIMIDFTGLTGAMKAIWSPKNQQLSTLCGCLMPTKSGKWDKRGIWWAYETLGQMDGAQRAKAASSNKGLNVLASIDEQEKKSVVLLGNAYGGGGKGGLGATAVKNKGYEGPVSIVISGADVFGKSVHAKVERIPFADNKAVNELPPPIVDKQLTVENGRVKLDFDWPSADDAYRVILTK